MKNTLKNHLLFLLLILAGLFMFSQHSVLAGELTMHTIYVDRGDAILLESGGEYMLVDSGLSSTSGDLISYLDKQNIPNNYIKYIVSTHPDGDHVGGFSALLAPTSSAGGTSSSSGTTSGSQSSSGALSGKYTAGQVIYSPCKKESKVYGAFIDTLNALDVRERTPVEGEKWELGDSVVEVVYDGSRGEEFIDDDSDDTIYNASSIVLKVTCDGKSILLTGDLPSSAERRLLAENKYNFKADILKVGHHGAAASSCADFLDAVDPQYAVISCAKDSELPKPQTLKRLARRFIKTYRTSDVNAVEAVVMNIKNGVISTNAKENNGYTSIKNSTVTLSNNVFYATGSAIKPSVSISLDGSVISSEHYTLTYSSNKNTGTGKIKISAVETDSKYVGTCYATFIILPQKETLKASLSGVNGVSLTWSDQTAASGYTLQYSTDKTFASGVSTLNFNNPQIVTTALTNLSFNKKYYFRVRAYKTTIGVGQWSSVKKIKTAKKPVPAKTVFTAYKAYGKGKIRLTWKKLAAKYSAGYIIQYSTDKTFKKAKRIKTVNIKKAKTTTRRLKNLERKKNYYIRIRGCNQYAVGKWSKIIKIKTK